MPLFIEFQFGGTIALEIEGRTQQLDVCRQAGLLQEPLQPQKCRAGRLAEHGAGCVDELDQSDRAVAAPQTHVLIVPVSQYDVWNQSRRLESPQTSRALSRQSTPTIRCFPQDCRAETTNNKACRDRSKPRRHRAPFAVTSRIA